MNDENLVRSLSFLLAQVAAVEAATDVEPRPEQRSNDENSNRSITITQNNNNNNKGSNAGPKSANKNSKSAVWDKNNSSSSSSSNSHNNSAAQPRLPFLSASFFSLAADVNSDGAVDGAPLLFDIPHRAEAATIGSDANAAASVSLPLGYHGGTNAFTPEGVVKTPSTSPYSVTAGLTPSTHSSSVVRPYIQQSATAAAASAGGGVGTPTAKASPSVTPFWMGPHGCGPVNSSAIGAKNNSIDNNSSRSFNDPMNSLNLVLNLSPVNAPINSAAAATSPPHSNANNGMVLSGGPYTLQQYHVASGLQTGMRGGGGIPQPQQQKQQLPCVDRYESPSESLRDTTLMPPPLPSSHLVGCQGMMMTSIPATGNNNSNSSGNGGHHSAWMISDEHQGSLKSSLPPSGGEVTGVFRPDSSAASARRHLPYSYRQAHLSPVTSLASSGAGDAYHAPMALPDRHQSPVASGAPLRSPELSSSTTSRASFQLALHRGSVVKMVSDQQGCRALQSVLEHYPYHTQEVQCIVSELLPVLPQVMTNPYGNFLVQKLLEIAPDEERLRLLAQHLSGSLCEVAVSPHGNYAVQKLIDSLRSRREVEVVCTALQRGVLMLMNDLNGGHVVQKLLQCLQPSEVVFLYDAIVERTLDVCNDKQGCCVVQKCMDRAPPDQLLRLKQAVLHHMLPLSMSPFGNYVVAHLIIHCDGLRQQDVVDEAALRAGPALELLCTNKFASNVVENIVRLCSEHAKVELCRILLQGSNDKMSLVFGSNGPHNRHHQQQQQQQQQQSSSRQALHNGSSVLANIVLDPYGNYVVQTMLSVLPVGPELVQLLRQLQRYLPALMEANFGKRVAAKMEQARARVTQCCPPKALISDDEGNSSAGMFARVDTAAYTQHHHHRATAMVGADSATPQSQPTAATTLLLSRDSGTSAGENGSPASCFGSPSTAHVSSMPPHGQQPQQRLDFYHPKQQQQQQQHHGGRYRGRRDVRAK
ncbi:putative pumilio/PUF RNA binding protein 4 [Trypanosoma grayi]|uniref:putative pumilio/PUF RNA binding protein 4 n=1 Tax=Trypanosoma grayi TaxID=71804 RepID=UPI0004F42BA1|nr:putative pumilio/PUF RNA binding protein 4 [Trypanosoma grayi]KEG07223.1 putative pumilio/PUF RNA binding protein 4 [Trypanosoma grayi]